MTNERESAMGAEELTALVDAIKETASDSLLTWMREVTVGDRYYRLVHMEDGTVHVREPYGMYGPTLAVVKASVSIWVVS
jgi:hypothetical protein